MMEQKRIFLPDGSSYAVNARTLTEEQATATVAGVRSPWANTVASGLKPDRVGRILRQSAEQGGDTRDYLTLLEEIEERDAHYRAQLMTRKLAIRGLEPQIQATAESGKPVEIADELRKIVKTPRFRRMIFDLMDGISKGYSAVEMMWDTARPRWAPTRWEWRDQRWFQYDRLTGRELRLKVDGSTDGEMLPPGKYIIHEPKLKSGLPIRGGIGRTVVWLFLLKSFTMQDWMTFLDAYGIPIRIGKWGQGASEADKRTLLRAVTHMLADAAVTIPQSMIIETLDAKLATGTDAHERATDFVNAEISKVVVGQTMTAEDGASLAQAEVHDRVRLDIAEADADDLADSIQIGFIEPYCSLNHGLQPEDCPQFTLPVPKPKDMKSRMEVIKSFVEIGGEVSMAEVRDELALKDPGKDKLLGIRTPAPPEGGSQSPPSDRPSQPGKAPALNHAANCPCCGSPRLAYNRSVSYGADDVFELIPASFEGISKPLLKPLLAAIDEAENFEEALAAIEAASPDSKPLLERLATLMTISRGIGDAKD